MAITKMTADEIKTRPSKRNRAKIDATTEENIRRQMIEDGDNPDEELSEQDIISPWYIRKRLGMSQGEFADTLGIPVATLRNWEQNRSLEGRHGCWGQRDQLIDAEVKDGCCRVLTKAF